MLPIPCDTGDNLGFDLAPPGLNEDPPLYDPARERLEAVVRWELGGASSARPPSDRLGSVRGG